MWRFYQDVFQFQQPWHLDQIRNFQRATYSSHKLWCVSLIMDIYLRKGTVLWQECNVLWKNACTFTIHFYIPVTGVDATLSMIKSTIVVWWGCVKSREVIRIDKWNIYYCMRLCLVKGNGWWCRNLSRFCPDISVYWFLFSLLTHCHTVTPYGLNDIKQLPEHLLTFQRCSVALKWKQCHNNCSWT